MTRNYTRGSLFALLFTSGVTAFGCDSEEKAPPVVRERSAAVVAKPGAAEDPSQAVEPGKAPVSAAVETKKPRPVLCADAPSAKGKEWPGKAVSVEAAPGVKTPAAEIPVGKGQWTWINLWAAWCVPCKKEIPILKDWESKLNAAGEKGLRLVFVSLDDDARQLHSFMDSQPEAGLRASYWLQDGKQRQEWFEAIELEPDIQLPAHILVNPKGEVSCVITGAIEAEDFAQVKKLTQG
jgi:thiol-disulfide isomerase/thioredoxin